MTKVEELQKRVEHLETEVELLKEIIKLQSKLPERIVTTTPKAPDIPWYRQPFLETPPYKWTCGEQTWTGREK